jgi:hypothetical protein
MIHGELLARFNIDLLTSKSTSDREEPNPSRLIESHHDDHEFPASCSRSPVLALPR